MDNFNLKKFLTENRLTRASKLVRENDEFDFNSTGMSYEEFLVLPDVTDQYLKRKGLVRRDEEGFGYELLQMLGNPKQVASFPAEEDQGAEYIEVYDLGDGHLLGIEDYTGYGAIYKKTNNTSELVKESKRTLNFKKKFLTENRLTTNSRMLKESTNLSPDLKNELDIIIGNISETIYEELGVEFATEEEIEVYRYLISKLEANLREAESEMLGENKLTRAAKLNEQANYRYFDDEGTGGTVIGRVDGKTVYALEDSDVFDVMFYAVESETGVEFVTIEVRGESITASEIMGQLGANRSPKLAELIKSDIDKELGHGDEMYEQADEKAKLKEASYWDSFDSPLAKKLAAKELYYAAVNYEGTYKDIVPFFEALLANAEKESGETLKRYEKSALIDYAANIIRRRAEMDR